MFCWCRKNTITVKILSKPKAFGWPRNIAAMGALKELTRDASEDIRLIKATNSHTKQQITPSIKDKAIATPINVATPLPPLNLSQIGKQWPTKAPKAES